MNVLGAVLVNLKASILSLSWAATSVRRVHPAPDAYTADLLILTGADPARITAHVDDVRRAVETPRYC